MPRYADDAKEQVRDVVDFERLVGAHTDLRRAGVNRLTGLCPFHDERTPSFGIDPQKKVFYCFGCGAAGDVFEFAMRTEGVGFVEALETLAERAGITLERQDEDPAAAARRRERERLMELLARASAYYQRALWESEEGKKGRDHLAGRGLEEAVARRFGVGYAPSAWDTITVASQRAGFSPAEIHASGLGQHPREGAGLYDRFRRRLMFPLADARGRVIGFGARALGADQQPKYLNSPEGPVYHKGRQLFGLHLARPAAAQTASVVLAEGYTDVLALHQAGIEHAVAAMGTALTEDQVGELARMVGSGTLRLCLDADAAGQQAMLRSAALAARRRLAVEVVPLPPGSDPADLVEAEGAEAMRERLAGAMPFARFRVERSLDEAELGTAAGRDRALAEIAPVLGALARGALREELVRTVADRLAVSPELAASAVARAGALGLGVPTGAGRSGPAAGIRPGAGERADGAGPGATPGGDPGPEAGFREAGRPSEDGGGGRGRAGGRAGAGGRGGAGGRADARGSAGRGAGFAALDRRAETERAFLAYCIALPEAGRDALARVHLDQHFDSPLARRAAAHLADHLTTPLAALPDEDADLARLMAELVVRAGDEGMTEAGLDVELLQLERARLEREIAAAQRTGKLVGELAARRSKLRDELDRAVDRAMRAGDG